MRLLIKSFELKFENWTVLILDEQFAWLSSYVYPSILTDFEDGLSISIGEGGKGSIEREPRTTPAAQL